MTPALHKLLDWYASLDSDSLERLPDFYTENCYFKDPFHETRSRRDIHLVFSSMFENLESPRFIFDEKISNEDRAFVTWHFEFGWKKRRMTIRGGSHLRFSNDGRVEYHRDYWDAAEELYEKLPALGWILRRMKAMARA